MQVKSKILSIEERQKLNSVKRAEHGNTAAISKMTKVSVGTINRAAGGMPVKLETYKLLKPYLKLA